MKRLIAACVLSCAVVLASAPAHAQTAGVSDRAGDVWNSDKHEAGSWSPDIAGLRVAHTRSRVVATVGFHRLGKLAYDVLEVRINTDADRAAEYRFADERDSGDSGVFEGAAGDHRLCSTRVELDAEQDVVRVSAPRSCFGNPRRISAKADFVELVWGNRMSDATRWTDSVRRG